MPPPLRISLIRRAAAQLNKDHRTPFVKGARRSLNRQTTEVPEPLRPRSAPQQRRRKFIQEVCLPDQAAMRDTGFIAFRERRRAEPKRCNSTAHCWDLIEGSLHGIVVTSRMFPALAPENEHLKQSLLIEEAR